jgi:hypothetical protein
MRHMVTVALAMALGTMGQAYGADNGVLRGESATGCLGASVETCAKIISRLIQSNYGRSKSGVAKRM